LKNIPLEIEEINLLIFYKFRKVAEIFSKSRKKREVKREVKLSKQSFNKSFFFLFLAIVFSPKEFVTIV
jgi:hypothetical protein